MANRKPNPEVSDSVFEMLSMKGKVVLITGGGAGIGLEVTKGLAEAGANVAIIYNSSKEAEQIASEVSEKYKIKCLAYKCDVADLTATEETFEKVLKDFGTGKIDVVIANSGIPSHKGALDSTIEDWKKVVDVDFTGAFYTAKCAGAIFKKQGFGSLIFTASMSGHIVNFPQMQACYNACKAAIIHLAKSLAIEYRDFARVNSVSPGYIHTAVTDFVPDAMKEQWYARIPMGRDADPRELKGIYLYLASNASTYTTGSDFIIDGGYTSF